MISPFFVLNPERSDSNKRRKAHDDSTKVVIDLYDVSPELHAVGPQVEKKLTKDQPIVGYMDGQLSYSMKANYDQFINAGNVKPFVQNLVSFQEGLNLKNAGFITKKFYNGSGYVNIGLKMRLHNDYMHSVNDDKTESNKNWTAMECSQLLLASLLPSDNSKLKDSQFTAVDPNLFVQGVDTAKDVFQSFFDSRNLWSKNPPLVWISVGNYFKKSYMFIESIDITPSEAMMKFDMNGFERVEPAWVDISLSLSSLYAASVFSNNDVDEAIWLKYGTGFVSGKTNRVIIDTDSAPDIATGVAGPHSRR